MLGTPRESAASVVRYAFRFSESQTRQDIDELQKWREGIGVSAHKESGGGGRAQLRG